MDASSQGTCHQLCSGTVNQSGRKHRCQPSFRSDVLHVISLPLLAALAGCPWPDNTPFGGGTPPLSGSWRLSLAVFGLATPLLEPVRGLASISISSLLVSIVTLVFILLLLLIVILVLVFVLILELVLVLVFMLELVLAD